MIGVRPHEGALLGGWQVLFFIFAVVTRADMCRQVCIVFYFIVQWKGYKKHKKLPHTNLIMSLPCENPSVASWCL